jgi:hypothetical protein|tara:strand:- start:683 stop:913 length:231 start_codon:yes stop_codon:yes gene_type:complete
MAGAEYGPLGTPEFNPYSAGARIYGSGRLNPTSGAVDPTGYAERDRKRKAKLNALRAKTKASANKNYSSPNFKRFI